MECGIVAGCRLIGKSIGRLAVVVNWSMKTLNRHSRNGAITLGDCTKSTEVVVYSVKTAIFGAYSSWPPLIYRGGKLVWSADDKSSAD